MLSKLELKLLIITHKICGSCYIFPARTNPKADTVTYRRSWVSMLNYLLCSLHYSLYMIYVAMNISSFDENPTDFIYSAFMVLTMAAAFTVFSNFYLYSREHLQLFNNVMYMNRNKICCRNTSERNTYAIFLGFLVICALSVLAQLLIFKLPNFSSIIVKVVFCIVHVLVTCSITIAGLCTLSLFIATTVTIIYFLRKCTNEIESDGIIVKHIITYKALQLLNEFGNETFGYIFVPYSKLSAILLFYFSAYTCIMFQSRIPIGLFMVFPLYTLTLLVTLISGAYLLSLVYNLSCKLLENIPKTKNYIGIENRLVFKSVQPLKCKVGIFYYMENKAKLTLTDKLANGLVFLISSSE